MIVPHAPDDSLSVFEQILSLKITLNFIEEVFKSSKLCGRVELIKDEIQRVEKIKSWAGRSDNKVHLLHRDNLEKILQDIGIFSNDQLVQLEDFIFQELDCGSTINPKDYSEIQEAVDDLIDCHARLKLKSLLTEVQANKMSFNELLEEFSKNATTKIFDPETQVEIIIFNLLQELKWKV